jgi:hypothetical protein
MQNLEYRMYGLVPYNLSPIQQGIQFGHAVVEYGLIYSDTPEYKMWAEEHKTFIILNGGTTNLNFDKPGTLNQHAKTLEDMGIKTAEFYEPDLGDQLTAVVFIVDERVFNRTKYPDYNSGYVSNFIETKPIEEQYQNWKSQFSDTPENVEKILSLRSFLSQFKLA